jgi:CheY-like chemotaxis protein
MSSILLVHHSKVVRVTLTRHLHENYAILEAQDVESAWQSLVLHHDVAAVISGLDVSQSGDVGTTSTWVSGMDTQLSGFQLLDRLRQNNLPRLKHIPFYIIASESRIEEISEEAKQHGVTGFLANGMSKEEIVAILSASLHETPLEAEKPAGKPVPDISGMRSVGLLSDHLFKEGVQRMFARSGTRGAVLLFCLEHYADLVRGMGKAMAHGIVEKFAGLVYSKVAAGDFVGYYGDGCFAIATHISNQEQCVAFAGKVVKSLSSAKIAARGKPLRISVQYSMVCCPADGNLDGRGILDLLETRLAEKIPTRAAPAKRPPAFPPPEQRPPVEENMDFPGLDIGAPTFVSEPVEAKAPEPAKPLEKIGDLLDLGGKEETPPPTEEKPAVVPAPRKIPTAPEIIPNWELL